MAAEQAGKYEIEYEAVALPESAGWAAFVAVFGESENPAHRKEVIARKRVAVDQTFDTEEAALEEAHRLALELIA